MCDGSVMCRCVLQTTEKTQFAAPSSMHAVCAVHMRFQVEREHEHANKHFLLWRNFASALFAFKQQVFGVYLAWENLEQLYSFYCLIYKSLRFEIWEVKPLRCEIYDLARKQWLTAMITDRAAEQNSWADSCP